MNDSTEKVSGGWVDFLVAIVFSSLVTYFLLKIVGPTVFTGTNVGLAGIFFLFLFPVIILVIIGVFVILSVVFYKVSKYLRYFFTHEELTQ